MLDVICPFCGACCSLGCCCCCSDENDDCGRVVEKLDGCHCLLAIIKFCDFASDILFIQEVSQHIEESDLIEYIYYLSIFFTGIGFFIDILKCVGYCAYTYGDKEDLKLSRAALSIVAVFVEDIPQIALSTLYFLHCETCTDDSVVVTLSITFSCFNLAFSVIAACIEANKRDEDEESLFIILRCLISVIFCRSVE